MRDGVVALRGLVLLALAAAGAHAQAAPTLTLKPADAKLDEEFTRISGVRELADGRLLVADGKELRLVVADLRTGKVEPVGRTGAGPGEYRSLLGGLVALPGDSTLVVDNRNLRWLLMRGARFVGLVAPESPAVIATRVLALSADRSGHVLARAFALPQPGRPFLATDSLYAIRVERTTGRIDTLGKLRSQYERGEVVPMGKGAEVSVPPIAVGEQALLFPDGWVAIARLEPYRIDWRSPDARVIRGPPLPFTTVRVDEREQRGYLDRETRAWGRAPAYLDPRAWPPVLPPFERDALLAAPDGKLLVHRMPSAFAPAARYDLVDRTGALVGQLRLGEGERMAAFGARSAYIVATDDDGIQRLRRHPWP